MTATEELRRMLDERGVEWWPMHDVEAGYYQDRDTEFVIDGKKYTAHEWGGRLTVYGLTPEQAIAATLGRGTCHMRLVYEEEDADGFIWPDHYECIVRCKDCKHCREHDMRAYGGDRDQLLCHHFSMSSGAGWPVEPDGFCKWAVRRADG